MITVTGVRKRFGAVTAVEEVSFSAPDGRVTGLVGPNGAGKTTVMRMITGVVRPDAGQVIVDGVEVAADPLRAARSLGALPDGASYCRCRSSRPRSSSAPPASPAPSRRRRRGSP